MMHPVYLVIAMNLKLIINSKTYNCMDEIPEEVRIFFVDY